jgi:hypothetical protein
MVDVGIGKPIPLSIADLTKSFIYQRGWGVSYVNPGCHRSAMTLLFTFHKGYDRVNLMLDSENFDSSNGLQLSADAWATLPGIAWRSSVGKSIEYNDLNASEMIYLL